MMQECIDFIRNLTESNKGISQIGIIFDKEPAIMSCPRALVSCQRPCISIYLSINLSTTYPSIHQSTNLLPINQSKLTYRSFILNEITLSSPSHLPRHNHVKISYTRSTSIIQSANTDNNIINIKPS